MPQPNSALRMMGTIQCTDLNDVRPRSRRPTGQITAPYMPMTSLDSGGAIPPGEAFAVALYFLLKYGCVAAAMICPAPIPRKAMPVSWRLKLCCVRKMYGMPPKER